jgi:hypothetical protein
MEIALGRALSPARLVILAWLSGAVTLLLALALDLAHAQEVWLELAVLIWLSPLAAYDLRYREVPHMACVAVLCAAAVVYSFLKGAWPVGVIALLAVAASERRVLRHARIERWAFSGALIVGALLVPASGAAVPGAFAVLGFWLAYELRWWAGADALAAMTLALLWPEIRLLLALGVAHMSTAVCIHVFRLFRSRTIGLRFIPVPGLPVIFLAVLLRTSWSAGWLIGL